jgi:TRAP-type C4-dicarboxylate transport system substrate-binding protein
MKIQKAIILSFVLTVSLIFLPSISPAQKQIVLRFAHFLQDTKLNAAEHYLADEVYKRTNGKVKIELFYGQTLGKATEFLGMLKDGSLDMAGVSHGYYSSQFPLWSATQSIPFMMRSGKTVMEVAYRIPKEIPAVQEEFRKWNVKYLNYCEPVLHYTMFSRKPANTVADLKGMKVRTYGMYLPQAMKAVGAVGVTIHPAETYESLKRGVIDATIFDISGGYFMKSYEVAKHVIPWDIQSICGYSHMMNLDVWESLPKDVQRIILEVEAENRSIELEYKEKLDKEAVGKLKEAGAVLHKVSNAERQKWVDANPDFVGQWIETCEKIGKGDEARQMRDLMMEIINKYDK